MLRGLLLYAMLHFVIHASAENDAFDVNTTSFSTPSNKTLGTLSIFEELLNWQIPTDASDSPIPPIKFASTCNMLCSIGWEEVIHNNYYNHDNNNQEALEKRKVLRCKTVQLQPVNFEADECDEEGTICTRVLE